MRRTNLGSQGLEVSAQGLGCMGMTWAYDIVPIPGTKRPERLSENAAAVEVELSDVDVPALDQAVPADAVVGGRYREAEMAPINV